MSTINEIKEEVQEANETVEPKAKEDELSTLSNSICDEIDEERFKLPNKQYTCDECEEVPKIVGTNLTKKTIIFRCKNHGQKEINLKYYINNALKYSYNNWKCEICDNVNKDGSFVYCYCKKAFCPGCYNAHKTKTSHKSIDSKYYYLHCQKKDNDLENPNKGYCLDCHYHYCKDCIEEHDWHTLIDLDKVGENINPIQYLKKLNKEYQEIIDYYNGLIKLNNLLIDSFENLSDNYCNLYNIYSIIANVKRKKIINSLDNLETKIIEPGEKSANHFKYMKDMFDVDLKEDTERIEIIGKFFNDFDLRVLTALPIKTLSVLDLQNCNITNIDCFEKAEFPDLIILNLDYNAITDISVIERVKFVEIQCLLIRDNNIRDISVFGRIKYDKFRQIDLRDNAIDDISVFGKVDLPMLQCVYLTGNKFDVDKDPAAKKKIEQLIEYEF